MEHNSFSPNDIRFPNRLQENSALPLNVCFFNHSCVPNATFFFVNNLIFVVSVTEISENEQVFINYADFSMQSPRSLSNKFQEQFRFRCRCSLCQKRLGARAQLYEVLNDQFDVLTQYCSNSMKVTEYKMQELDARC